MTPFRYVADASDEAKKPLARQSNERSRLKIFNIATARAKWRPFANGHMRPL